MGVRELQGVKGVRGNGREELGRGEGVEWKECLVKVGDRVSI